MSLLVVVVVLYPLILLSISVYRARSVTSHDDFMVAGRSVPVYMLVGTLVCTWIGSGSLFGASGLAYTVGNNREYPPATTKLVRGNRHVSKDYGDCAKDASGGIVASFKEIGNGVVCDTAYPTS